MCSVTNAVPLLLPVPSDRMVKHAFGLARFSFIDRLLIHNFELPNHRREVDKILEARESDCSSLLSRSVLSFWPYDVDSIWYWTTLIEMYLLLPSELLHPHDPALSLWVYADRDELHALSLALADEGYMPLDERICTMVLEGCIMLDWANYSTIRTRTRRLIED